MIAMLPSLQHTKGERYNIRRVSGARAPGRVPSRRRRRLQRPPKPAAEVGARTCPSTPKARARPYARAPPGGPPRDIRDPGGTSRAIGPAQAREPPRRERGRSARVARGGRAAPAGRGASAALPAAVGARRPARALRARAGRRAVGAAPRAPSARPPPRAGGCGAGGGPGPGPPRTPAPAVFGPFSGRPGRAGGEAARGAFCASGRRRPRGAPGASMGAPGRTFGGVARA